MKFSMIKQIILEMNHLTLITIRNKGDCLEEVIMLNISTNTTPVAG